MSLHITVSADWRWAVHDGGETVMAGQAASEPSACASARFAAGAVLAFRRLARASGPDSVEPCASSTTSPPDRPSETVPA